MPSAGTMRWLHLTQDNANSGLHQQTTTEEGVLLHMTTRFKKRIVENLYYPSEPALSEGFGNANHGINRNIENWDGLPCRNPLNPKRLERMENPLAQYLLDSTEVMPRFEEWKDAHIAGQPNIVHVERTKASATLPATVKSKRVPVMGREDECFITDITESDMRERGENSMAGHMTVNSQSEHQIEEGEDCFIVEQLELQRRERIQSPSASGPAVTPGGTQRREGLPSNYLKAHAHLEKRNMEFDKAGVATGNRENLLPIKGMAKLLSALTHPKESCENAMAEVTIAKPAPMQEGEEYENHCTMGRREPERREGMLNSVAKPAHIKLSGHPWENARIPAHSELERTDNTTNSNAGSLTLKEESISRIASAPNHSEIQRQRNKADFMNVKSRHASDTGKYADPGAIVPPELEHQKRPESSQAVLVTVKQENMAEIDAIERPRSMDLCDSDIRGMKEYFEAGRFKETSSAVQPNSLAAQTAPGASSQLTNSQNDTPRSLFSVESGFCFRTKNTAVSIPCEGCIMCCREKQLKLPLHSVEESESRHLLKQQNPECHEEQKPNALSVSDKERIKHDYGEINLTIMRTSKGNKAYISKENAKALSKMSFRNLADGSKSAERHKITTARQREHVEKKYSCTECGMRFRYDASRRRHQARTGDKMSQCVVCGKVFASLSCLLWHQQTHSEHYPHACTKCGKRFRLRTSLYRHLRTHPQESYICSVCGSSFKHLGPLHRHEQIHTGPYPCPQCGKNFKYPSALLLHERIHKYKPCTCAKCGKTFTDQAALHKHEQVHAVSRPYSCTKCRRFFKDSTALQLHEQKHAAQRPYSCTECRKTFLYASSLHSHYRMHTGEKLYPCTECGKSFLNQSSMQRHQRQSHKPETPPVRLHVPKKTRKRGGKYQCIQCGMNFNNQSRLSRHHQMHIRHSEKPYACVDCGKRFSDALLLNNHEQVHFTKKKFKCDQCGKRFRVRKSFTIHYRIHTGEKPYSCPECDRRFSDPSCWRKHVKKHKKE